MTLEEMIDKLRYPHRIEIRDEDNCYICTTRTDTVGIKPYVSMNVTEWFASSSDSKIVVCLDGIHNESNSGN